MAIYRRADDKQEEEKKEERKEEPKQEISTASFKNFVNKPESKAFIEDCHHRYNVTEAGMRELLWELYQRYGGDGDDDDEDKVKNRASEMLDVMKSVADKFALFKKD